MAKAVKNPEYTIELTLTQREAEDLRALLWSHMAGSYTAGEGSFATIQRALKDAGVDLTKTGQRVSWLNVDGRQKVSREPCDEF